MTRNAFERVYDMILSYGTETYEVAREKRVHYNFFDDPDNDGATPCSASTSRCSSSSTPSRAPRKGYGIEKRVLLLHGPVGSSKSTIARLAEEGPGALLADRRRARSTRSAGSMSRIAEHVHWCPMHEEPLHLIPERFRDDIAAQLNEGRGEGRLSGPDSRRALPLLPLMSTPTG